MGFSTGSLKEALETLGELLAERGQSAEIVVIGGGSLLLLGLITRPTKDLDVVALVEAGEYRTAQPLPDFLTTAIVDVATEAKLAKDWLNGGPTEPLKFGLPEEFESRVTIKNFGGLIVQMASRLDQICFKLYAAVDQGPKSKYAADLKILKPSTDELQHAATWAKTHDPSEGFEMMLNQAVRAGYDS